MKKKGTFELKTDLLHLRSKVQRKIRRAELRYIGKLFEPTFEETAKTPSTKRLWTYLKHKRTSSSGIPPLKENGRLVTDTKAKAELLNQQFFKAFSDGQAYTQEDFLQKCTMPSDESDFPQMENITVTTKGVEKLLENLNPYKAPGPDRISPRILKVLAAEIAPILAIIYTTSLDSRTLKIKVPKIKEQAYKAMVRPVLEYSSTVWDPYTAEEINQLESVQNAAARYVVGDYRRTTSITALLNRLKWPSLQKRRTAARLTMLYKIRHKKASVNTTRLRKPRDRPRRGHDQQYERIMYGKKTRHRTGQHGLPPTDYKVVEYPEPGNRPSSVSQRLH
ncbi:hypothetical protein ACOMHN_031902 [Nucella lapillus]